MSDAIQYLDQFRIAGYKNQLRDHVALLRKNPSVLAYLEMASAMESMALDLRKDAAKIARERADFNDV